MKLTDKLLSNFSVNKEALIPYGFIKDNNKFIYKKNISSGDLELVITIENQNVSSKIINKDFGDEFTLINTEDAIGEYLVNVTKECTEIITDIRNNCFSKQYFYHSQSNRITDYIIKKYDASPEFLWDDSPDYGVFRNKRTNKWFGIIMNIKKEKLVKNSEGYAEVINLKLDKETEKAVLNQGIYPAYHMNKKNWVSVILDNTIKDDYIFNLVETSYNLSDKIK